MIGLLARCAIRKCCKNEDHITNFDKPTYIRDMKANIMKLSKLLKSLVHLRRIKNPKVLNPLVLMGIVGPEAAPADEMMWGRDPVHPKRGAYATMAARVLDEIGSSTVRHPKRSSDPGTSTGQDYGIGQLGRVTSSNWSCESWTGGSQTVAARRDDLCTPHHQDRTKYGGQRGAGGYKHQPKPYRRR